MNRRDRISEFCDRFLNPIMVKELRQAVRSRFIVGGFVLFLLILLITTGGFILTQSMQDMLVSSSSMRMGRDIFEVLLAVLTGSCLLLVPTYTGVRLGIERWENNMDLLFTTTLSRGAIIRGKLAAGSVITLLLFSACMPFMSFTYLMRGIDLPSIFVIMTLSFLAVVLANLAFIFLACIPAPKALKILMILPGLFGLMMLLTGLIAWSNDLLRSGVGSMLLSSDFWEPAGWTLAAGLALCGGCYVLAVAMITPPYANRAKPVRIYATVIWFVSALAAMAVVIYEGDGDYMMAWMVPSLFALALAMPVVLSESDALSIRVRRDIPQRRCRRGVAFLFFNGPASGILWVALLCLITLSVGLWFMGQFGSPVSRSDMEFIWVMCGVLTYFAAYSLTAAWIRRVFAAKYIPYWGTWVVALLLVAAGSIFPLLVALALGELDWNMSGVWQLGNIFGLADDDFREMHLIFSGGWACVALMLNAAWFRRQSAAFKPWTPPKTEA